MGQQVNGMSVPAGTKHSLAQQFYKNNAWTNRKKYQNILNI